MKMRSTCGNRTIRVRCISVLLLMSSTTSACLLQRPTLSSPGLLKQGSDHSGYSVQSILAHSCERLFQEFDSVYAIRIAHPKVFGFNDKKAIVYANFYVIPEQRYEHIPQIYPLVLRTENAGESWTQDLDPAEHWVSDIVALRFINEEAGWLAWAHDIEGNAFGLLHTRNGGLTWHEIIPGTQGILDAFSFSSPWAGSCVVSSPSGVPFASDMERDEGSWVVGTEDGGESWKVIQALQTGPSDWNSAKQSLPPSNWLEASPQWILVERTDSFAVKCQKASGQWHTVLTLPSTYFETETQRERQP